MAANTRTPLQRERDLAETARRYLHGETQALIAESLGVTQQQISHDLKVLQGRWLKSSLVDIDEAKGRELERVNDLERVYWTAWERSLQERTITSTKKRGKDDAEASLRREQRDGNPAFLAGVQWCIGRRCAILGLDAPEKRELSGKDGAPIRIQPVYDLRALDDEELVTLERIIGKAAIRGLPEPAGDPAGTE